MIPRMRLRQPVFNSRMMRQQPRMQGRISMMLPMSQTARRLQKIDNARGTLAKKRYPYQDFDHDGVMNKYDCQPYNAKKQGIKEVFGAVKTGAAFVAEKTSAGARVVASGVASGVRNVGERAARGVSYVEEKYEKYKAEEPERLKRKIEVETKKVELEEKRAELRKLRGSARPPIHIDIKKGEGGLFRAEPRQSGSYNPTASTGYFQQQRAMAGVPPQNPYLKYGFGHAPVVRQQLAMQQTQQAAPVQKQAQGRGLKKGGMFIKPRRVYLRPEEIEEIKRS